MPHRSEPPISPASLSGPRAAGSVASTRVPSPSLPEVPLSVPLRALALLFVIGSVLVAALLGLGLATWLRPAAPWMVAIASAVGVLCTALPLGLGLLGLSRSRSSAPHAEPAPTAPSEPQPAVGAPGLPQGQVLTPETFTDMVAREWSRARRYGTGAALLMVQIDRYARLVEALGDAAGDKVLADLVAAIAPTLRGADALSRHEGGEFAVFLAHADATGSLDVAERIRERAEQMEVSVAARRVRFTVSVGVAHLRPAHLHLQAFIDDVTEALAAARTVGGNCVRAAPVDAGQRPAPGSRRDGSRADKS